MTLYSTILHISTLNQLLKNCWFLVYMLLITLLIKN